MLAPFVFRLTLGTKGQKSLGRVGSFFPHLAISRQQQGRGYIQSSGMVFVQRGFGQVVTCRGGAALFAIVFGMNL